MRDSSKSEAAMPAWHRHFLNQSGNNRKRAAAAADVPKETKSEINVSGNGQDAKKGSTSQEKGVADFWVSLMKINASLFRKITKRDERALRYLKDIKWRATDDDMGFMLEFVFDANPYFKNSSLTKTYYLKPDDKAISRPFLPKRKQMSRPLLERTQGTKIKWHPNKNLKRSLIKKKPRKESERKVAGPPKNLIMFNWRTIESDSPKYKCVESFFNFFNPQCFQVYKDDTIYTEFDHEMNDESKREMEEELDIGLTLRDRIIPHFASWFTGNETQGNNSEVKVEEDEESEVEDEDEEDEDDWVEYLETDEDTEFEEGD